MESNKNGSLQIAEVNEENILILNEDILTKVLLDKNIENRFVVLVSIAGAFRKGKSFLLNFFLRYLYTQV